MVISVILPGVPGDSALRVISGRFSSESLQTSETLILTFVIIALPSPRKSPQWLSVATTSPQKMWLDRRVSFSRSSSTTAALPSRQASRQSAGRKTRRCFFMTLPAALGGVFVERPVWLKRLGARRCFCREPMILCPVWNGSKNCHPPPLARGNVRFLRMIHE